MFCLTLAFSVWRGVWDLTTYLLFPNDKILSFAISAFCGYFLVIVCHILQYPSSRISAKLDSRKWLKVVFEQLFHILAGFACIQAWRGAWELSKIYINPVAADKEVNGWVLVAIGYTVLLLMWTSNSLCHRGCLSDGFFSEGRGVLFQGQYLVQFFRHDLEHRQVGTD